MGEGIPLMPKIDTKEKAEKLEELAAEVEQADEDFNRFVKTHFNEIVEALEADDFEDYEDAEGEDATLRDALLSYRDAHLEAHNRMVMLISTGELPEDDSDA